MTASRIASRWLLGEGDAHLLLGPLDGGVGVDLGQRVRPGRESLDRPRDAEFGEEERLEEDENGVLRQAEDVAPGSRTADRRSVAFSASA